jgi:hypothetical protein
MNGTKISIFLSTILTCTVAAAGTASAGCGEFLYRGGYTVLRNTCSQTITIRWRDQGSCRSGCAARISGGSEQTVTQPQGDYRIVSED